MRLDANMVLDAVSSVGFPIVMCVILLWNMKDTSEKHKEESKAFTEALDKNTAVIQRLCDKLDVKMEV